MKKLSGLACHIKLVNLWKECQRANYQAKEIRIDIMTFDRLMCCREANIITNEKGHKQWRDIPFKVIVPPVTAGPVIRKDVSPYDVFEEKFCLSIVAEKPNGRIFYFDDPQTDEVYK